MRGPWSPLPIQQLEDALPLLQGLPGLVLLLFGGCALLLPGSHDLAECIHHLVVSHTDTLPQFLPVQLLFGQPGGHRGV